MSNFYYSRNDFRQLCLERDNWHCVVCGSEDDIVVHHVFERRLYADGGY